MKKYNFIWISCNFFALSSLACSFFLPGILPAPYVLLLVNLINLFTFLSLVYTVCALDNIPLAGFWGSFGLLLLLYGIISLLYINIEWIILLPLYFYELAMVLAAGFYVIRRWRFSFWYRGLASLLLILFGFSLILTGLPVELLSYSDLGIAWSIVFLICLHLLFSMLNASILQINDHLRDSYLRQMTENAVDVLFHYILEPYPRFLFISPSVEAVTGYAPKDFYQNPKLHLELTHEEDRSIMEQAFAGTATPGSQNFVRWQRKDGEHTFMEFHNSPVIHDGHVTAIDGILRDITRRKQVEQDLLNSKKAKQILLSYISHELKTPITYIIGYAEALQKNLFTDVEEQRKSVELISSKAQVLQRLVDDLFQLSKMESNQFRFEFQQISVADLYEVLVSRYQADVADVGLEFTGTIDQLLLDRRFEVLVDLERIQQVCTNLIQNAIKHTPEGGRIALQMQHHASKPFILFKVHDTGHGILEEDVPHIFDRFYRGKDPERQVKDGTGLGLSISKLIVEAHNGTIGVNSKKGKGSTFFFTIPLYTQEQGSLRI